MSWRVIAAVALAVSTAACGPASNAAARSPSQRDVWNTPRKPFQIIDNVHYVGTGGLGVYLFETNAGLVLLDGALPESVPMIEAHIRELGFALADVKILLNSHAHYDHSGGLAQLKKDTGAQLFAMEGDVSALEGGFYLGSEDDAELKAPPVKVDKVLHDGDLVTLGNVTLKANLTAGHSRGCTSYSTTAHENGTAYEVLVFCSATVAGNRITTPLQYPGIVEDYRKTFARTKAMHVDVFLAPHAEFFDLDGKAAKRKPGAPNPFVGPSEFPAFIARLEADFERTLAERTGASRGKGQ